MFFWAENEKIVKFYFFYFFSTKLIFFWVLAKYGATQIHIALFRIRLMTSNFSGMVAKPMMKENTPNMKMMRILVSNNSILNVWGMCGKLQQRLILKSYTVFESVTWLWKPQIRKEDLINIFHNIKNNSAYCQVHRL